MTSAPAPSISPVLAPAGVYAPQHDTALLTRAVTAEQPGPGTEVLDLGTGTGAVALHAARTGAHVTAVDISWTAVLTARLNAARAGCRMRVHRGDLTAPVTGRTFDLVVSNPPYVPAPEETPPASGPARAWDAGPDGRALLDRICADAPAALRPGGTLLLVHSALCGTEATLRRLAAAGMRAEVSDRVRIPYGPVLTGRREWLVARGLADGSPWEELVIVRAVHA
ncbi:methyltransferase [Streptomyces sp. CS227]|uniref:HemK2/MTQ2 family protein methyltransferase n=1 Tax=Streptomyces sp. CS227 TaxID=1982763 RepID=UPI000B416D7F|nr:HemK2/MTQ2 family protein methyltransferase [Streptomyces sp. CS227]OWA05654.1 methyltransferase [Streptomyces sp. CS227]